MVCVGVGFISYNSLSHLVFLQVKINSGRYIAQVVNAMLLIFFSTGGWRASSTGQRTSTHDVWLFGHPLLWHTFHFPRRNVLLVVYNNCPGQQYPQISRQLNTFKNDHCRIATTRARCLGLSITWYYSSPLWPFAYENTPLRCRQRGDTLSINVTVWASLTVSCVFHFLWICYHVIIRLINHITHFFFN